MEKKSAKSKLKCIGTPKASPKAQKASPKVQKASQKVQKGLANKAHPKTGKENVMWPDVAFFCDRSC